MDRLKKKTQIFGTILFVYFFIVTNIIRNINLKKCLFKLKRKKNSKKLNVFIQNNVMKLLLFVSMSRDMKHVCLYNNI